MPFPGRALVLATLLVLLASPSFAQGDPPRVVLVSGSLTFPAVTLTGDLVTTNGASNVPVLQCSDGVKAIGWNLTFQASALTNGTGTIPASSISFTASGGTIVKISGQNIDPTNGPKETNTSGTLNNPLKVLNTNSSWGKGTYNYTPLSSNFSIQVPATALAGTYTGTLTCTITTGP